MEHYTIKCGCGTVIGGCKCIPPLNIKKKLTIIPHGCPRCHNSEAIVYGVGDEWVISKDGNNVTVTQADWTYINSIIHAHYHGSYSQDAEDIE